MYNSDLTGLQSDGVYGEIHVHDNTTSQSIPDGVGYTKLTVWSDNGLSNGTTPDEVNGEITIDSSGIYKLEATLSFKSGTSNIVSSCSIFVNGVEQDQLHLIRKISVAGDIGSASITGFADVTAGQKVDIRMKHDDANPVNITIVYGNLNAELANV